MVYKFAFKWFCFITAGQLLFCFLCSVEIPTCRAFLIPILVLKKAMVWNSGSASSNNGFCKTEENRRKFSSRDIDMVTFVFLFLVAWPFKTITFISVRTNLENPSSHGKPPTSRKFGLVSHQVQVKHQSIMVRYKVIYSLITLNYPPKTFTREKTFVTFCFLSCTSNPFLKEV